MQELVLDVRGEWTNPYDPDEIDVVAHFTAPSGRRACVTGFWYQPHRAMVVAPPDRRRHVDRITLGLRPSVWAPGTELDLFIDDVSLIGGREGVGMVLEDFEAADLEKWPVWSAGTRAMSEEIAHGGRGALRFTPEMEPDGAWVSQVGLIDEADWSSFEGLSLWVYPRTRGPLNWIDLSFHEQGSDAYVHRLWLGSDLRANEWNHLVWDWGDLQPTVRMTPKGRPGWRVRFTPEEIGLYRYTVTARARRGMARSRVGEFSVGPSRRQGLVRVSEDDARYFALDSGRPYFPIGHDVHGYEDALADALEYFPKMQAHGEDATYVIMFPGNKSLGVEWDELGQYDQMASARMDWYVKLAERHGIRFKLAFDAHTSLRPSADWPQNPYNAVLGGPCETVNDFYTDPEALRFYTRRLRYIVARWGYSPNVMAWEFLAEIDGAAQLPDGREAWAYTGTPSHPRQPGAASLSAMLTAWLAKTCAYVRVQDPHDRPITESFGGDTSDPRVWEMDGIDYTQIHHYNSPDIVPPLSDWCRRLPEEHGKPMMVTEFGWGNELDVGPDPDGINLHNGIWASALSGAAGSAMCWWCDRVDQMDLYNHYRALARFARGVQWPTEGFVPARATVQSSASDRRFVPLKLPAVPRYTDSTVGEFVVAANGVQSDADQVPGVLFAPDRRGEHGAPAFHVDYPVAGSFTVRVVAVAPDARLEITLDGEPALVGDLPVENVPGKASIYLDEYEMWQCTYDEDFTIPVPAGKHVIRVSNSLPGQSWIRVLHYELGGYVPARPRALGLAGKTQALLWIQNPQSTWGNEIRGLAPEPVVGATLILQDARPGKCRVEWWDTYTGQPIGRQTQRVADASVTLAVPTFERDIACRIRWR